MSDWYSEIETIRRFGTKGVVDALVKSDKLKRHNDQHGESYYFRPAVDALWTDRLAIPGRNYSQRDLAILMRLATEFQPGNWLSLDPRWWRTPLQASSNTLGNIIVGGDNPYERHCLELAKHHPLEAYQALAKLSRSLPFEDPKTEAPLHNGVYLVFRAAEQSYTDPEQHRLSAKACAHAALMLRATAFNYLLFVMTREAPTTYVEAITGVPPVEQCWLPSDAMDHYKIEALFTRALTLATLAEVFDPNPEFFERVSKIIAARVAMPQG